MSTFSLPEYAAPSLSRIPLYSVEPHHQEQRIALADRLRPRPSGSFVKTSKGGDVRLTLDSQEDNITLPVYGLGANVEGTVAVSKPGGVLSVEVKVEGRLHLKEIGEGGTSTAKLCLNTSLLWIKDSNNTRCPPSMRFSLALPKTFTYEDKTYPLPPSFDVKLSGLPGFIATIEYSVTTKVSKHHPVSVKSLGIHIGETVVLTPFLYYPRSRPSHPIPAPLAFFSDGFGNDPEWRCFETTLPSRSSSVQDVQIRLHIPRSRVFCLTEPIPFHLTLESSAVSLAAYLPLGPTDGLNQHKETRIQVMRQTTVDVRNTAITGIKTDMWRVDSLGEGVFRHAGDGPASTSFSGEIPILPGLKVTSFKAAGLGVKDCILFTIHPNDGVRSPFGVVRLVIPIRLATDRWSANGAGIGAHIDATNWERGSTPSPVDSTQPLLRV